MVYSAFPSNVILSPIPYVFFSFDTELVEEATSLPSVFFDCVAVLAQAVSVKILAQQSYYFEILFHQ